MSKQCACGEREECDHSCMPDVIDGVCSHCGERANEGLPILPAGMTNELFYKEQAEYWRQIATQNQIHTPAQCAGDYEECRRLIKRIDELLHPEGFDPVQAHKELHELAHEFERFAAQPPAAPVDTKEERLSEKIYRERCERRAQLPAKSGSDGRPTTQGLEVPSGGSQPTPSELDANDVRTSRDSLERQATHSPCSAGTAVEPTFSAIHDALKAANLEYSAFSTDGVVVFGDKKSVQKAAEAFHSHSQIDQFRTQIRHWRDECGKLHARLNALPQTSGWRPIDTAPHEKYVLLGWWDEDQWNCETGWASRGWRRGGVSNMSRHAQATHWQPLPAGPSSQLSRPSRGGDHG